MRREDLIDLNGLPGRRGGAQLHPRRRQAWHIAIGAEPHRPPAGERGSACACSPAPPAASRPPRPASACCKRLRPALEDIDAGLAALGELRDKPAGTIRITTSEHAAHTILWPALERLLPDYPDIKVELSHRLRPHRHRRRSVSTPACGSANTSPRTWSPCASARTCAWRWSGRPPISPPIPGRDARRTSPIMTASTCACPPLGGLYAWEFEKAGRELRVRVEGQLVFNNTAR